MLISRRLQNSLRNHQKFATKALLITITTAGSLDYGPESVVSVAPETAAAGATAASSIEIAMIDFSS